MQKTVPFLEVGDQVSAGVIEIIDRNALIVSFSGDLLRVKNEAFRNFKVGDKVACLVKQKNPLVLKLLD